MSIRAVPLVLFLIVWASCTEVSVDTSPYHDSDIQSIVFRYQFYDNGSGYVSRGIVDPGANFFAVAVADVDTTWARHPRDFRGVPPEVLQAIRPAALPVRDYSECYRETTFSPVFDVRGGRRGILIWVGPVHVTGPVTAEAEGGYFLGGLNAEGDVFFLTLDRGNWRVDSLKSRWVS